MAPRVIYAMHLFLADIFAPHASTSVCGNIFNNNKKTGIISGECVERSQRPVQQQRADTSSFQV